MFTVESLEMESFFMFTLKFQMSNHDFVWELIALQYSMQYILQYFKINHIFIRGRRKLKSNGSSVGEQWFCLLFRLIV